MALPNSDWAWLPKNLLDSILVKLVSLSDYIRFGAVCKPWHSVAMDNHKQRQSKTCQPHHVPMLMIPTKDNRESRRSIYEVTKGKVCEFELPVPHNKRCCGSSHGWLLHLDENLVFSLSNPFSGDIIHLPPFCDAKKFWAERAPQVNVDYIIHKAILSADPCLSPDDYAVMVIRSCHRLAFIRSGDESWTYIQHWEQAFYDIISYRGMFNALEREGRVSCYDFTDHQLKIVAPARRIDDRALSKSYLVESVEGDLLWVRRSVSYPIHMTFRFRVRKLVYHNEQPRWVDLRCLDDCALFLGDNHSISVRASDFPGCQPNSIYFTDDYLIHNEYNPPYEVHGGPVDTGVYNLEDGSFRRHHAPNPSQNHMPPPIWILPTFKENWV